MNGGGFSSGILGSYCGIKIIINNNLVDQFRKPRSKSKRIQKKWRKRPCNWRPSRMMVHDRMREIVYCHSVMYEQIKQQIGS